MSGKYFHVIIIGLILTGAVYTDDRQFVRWWSKYDEQLQVSDYIRYSKKTELQFYSLQKYQGALEVPAGIRSKLGPVMILDQRPNRTILLVTPENIMKDVSVLNEQYKQTMMKCSEDTSWIVVLPSNAWTEIDLNPYCIMDYDEAGIRFDLYWTSSSTRPLIDVITDSPSCVPHRLYGWDKAAKKYVLKSRKCTGLREVDSYGAMYPRMRQLPPAEESR